MSGSSNSPLLVAMTDLIWILRSYLDDLVANRRPACLAGFAKPTGGPLASIGEVRSHFGALAQTSGQMAIAVYTRSTNS